MRARLIEWDRVVPAHDRIVEQVQTQAQSVASERVPLPRDIVVLGSAEVERLVLRPGGADIVEEQSVEWRQRDWQYAELEATHEREAQLRVRHRHATTQQLHGAAVRGGRADDRAGEIE